MALHIECQGTLSLIFQGSVWHMIDLLGDSFYSSTFMKQIIYELSYSSNQFLLLLKYLLSKLSIYNGMISAFIGLLQEDAHKIFFYIFIFFQYYIIGF